MIGPVFTKNEPLLADANVSLLIWIKKAKLFS